MADFRNKIQLGIKLDGLNELKNELNKTIQDLEKNSKININFNEKDMGSSLKKLENVLGNLNKQFQSGLNGKGLDDISNKIKNINNEMSKTQIFKDTGNGTELIQTVTKVNEGLGKTKTVINDVKKETSTIKESFNFNKVESTISSLQSKLNSFKGNSFIDDSVLGNLQNKLNSINTNTPEREIKELQNAIKNLGSSESQIVRVQNAITKAENSLSNIKGKYGSSIIDSKSKSELQAYEKELLNLKNILKELQNGNTFSNSKISSELNKASNSGRQLNNVLKETTKTSATFGSSLKEAMRNTGLYITAYQGIRMVTGAIKDGIQTITEIDTKMRDLKRVTDDASQETLASFPKQANDMAISLGQTTENAIRATTVWKQLGYSWKDSTEFLSKQSMVLANVGDMTADESTNALVSTLKAFRLEAKDTTAILDSLNEGGNKFAITSGELAKGIQTAGASMAVAHNDLYQSEALIITGTEVIRNSEEVANGLKTIGMRLDQVKTAKGDTFYKLKDDLKGIANVDLTDTNGDLRSTYDIILDLSKSWDSLSNMNQAKLLEEIAGKHQARILSAILQNAKQLPEAYNVVKNSAGSASEEQARYMDSIEAKANALKESVKKLWLEIISSDAIKKGIDFLTQIVQSLSKIDGATIKTTATFLALGTALKSIASLKGVGKTLNIVDDAEKIGFLSKAFTGLGNSLKGTVKSIGLFIATPLGATLTSIAIAIGGAVATYEGYQSLISKPLDTPTEELSGFERTINSFTGNVYKSQNELEKSGLVYEKFGENISDGFKSGVEKATDTYHNFVMEISKAGNLESIDIKGNVSGKIKGMTDNIVDEASKAILSNKSKINDSLSQLFNADGSLDEGESSVLNIISKEAEANLDKVSDLHGKIYDIWNKAIGEHGRLSEEDVSQIRNYVQQIQQIQMEASAENNADFFYAKNKFASRVNGLSLDDASKEYKTANTELKDMFSQKKSIYDSGIDMLKQQQSKLTKENAEGNKSEIEAIQKQIIEKEKVYDDLIKQEQGKRKELLEVMYKENPNLKGSINEITGEILSEKDKKAQAQIESLKQTYSGLSEVTKTGMQQLKDSTGVMRDVYVEVDKTTGDIVGVYDTYTGKIGGYTQKNSEDMEKFRASSEQSLQSIRNLFSGGIFQSNIVDGATASIENLGNGLGNLKVNGDIVGQLQSVKEEVDGTLTAMISINGQEIEIKTDTSGTITNLDEIAHQLNLIPEDKTITINENGAVEIKDKIDNVNASADNLDGKSANINVSESGAEDSSNKINNTNKDITDLDGKNANLEINTNENNSSGIIQNVSNWWHNLINSDNVITKTINVFKNAFGGDSEEIGHNASGTKNWRGGFTWVNEEGGELMNLPNGTQIIPHDLSEKIIEESARNAWGNKEQPIISTINIQPVDIYQGKQGNSDILSVNTANTLDKPYESDYVDTSSMSKEEKKAYEEKKRLQEEEEKALKDKEEKEKQYLDDIGTYWENNSKAVSDSIDKIELREIELGENITYSQKIDLLNQKYDAQLELLSDAEKQLNTYNQTTVITEKAQGELSKKIQSANETIVKQKKAIAEAYSEMEKYKKSTLSTFRDKLAQNILKQSQKEVDDMKEELEKAEKHDIEKLEKEKQSMIDSYDKKIESLRKQLEDLDNDEENQQKKLKELIKQRELWKKQENDPFAKKQIALLDKEIEETTTIIKKNEINKQINDLNKQKDEETKNLDDRKNEINDYYDKQKKKQEKTYKKMLKEEKAYRKADKLIKQNNMEDILQIMSDKSEDFKSVGSLLGENFREALVSEIEDAMDSYNSLSGKSSKKKKKESNDENWVADVGDHVKVSNSGGIYTYGDPSGRTESISGTLSQHNIRNGQEMVAKKYNNGFLLLKTTGGDEIGWVDRHELARYDTGGRTPDNLPDSGATAVLHKSEKILNKKDTVMLDEIYDFSKECSKVLEDLNFIMPEMYNNMQLANPPMLDFNKIASSMINNSNNNDNSTKKVSIKNEINVTNNTKDDSYFNARALDRMWKEQSSRFK